MLITNPEGLQALPGFLLSKNSQPLRGKPTYKTALGGKCSSNKLGAGFARVFGASLSPKTRGITRSLDGEEEKIMKARLC